ncbi:Ionotropic receptor 231, partial [Frankliniella occidentalis]
GQPTVGEINSLKELRASGLPVIVSAYLQNHAKHYPFPKNCRFEYPFYSGVLELVAIERNCSYFLHLEHIPLWMLETHSLHLIETKVESILPVFTLPRMSPLGERVRSGLLWVSEAGLMKYWGLWDHNATLIRLVRSRIQSGPQPLPIRAALPPLLLLGFGLGASAVVLAAEVAADNLSHCFV